MLRSLRLFVRSSSVLTLLLLTWTLVAALCFAAVSLANSTFGIPGLILAVIGLFLLVSALAERYL